MGLFFLHSTNFFSTQHILKISTLLFMDCQFLRGLQIIYYKSVWNLHVDNSQASNPYVLYVREFLFFIFLLGVSEKMWVQEENPFLELTLIYLVLKLLSPLGQEA